VAVRGPWPPEPDEVQRRFFTFKKYTYHRALVTNFGSDPPRRVAFLLRPRLASRFVRFRTEAASKASSQALLYPLVPTSIFYLLILWDIPGSFCEI